MARDIGGYFDRLTRKAKGGRRLESDTAPATEPDAGSSSAGGLADALKDILAKGRTSTTATAKRAAEKARGTTSRRPSRKRPPSRTRALPPEGVVRIEYSPHIDGDPDPGEVVWSWVPFEEDPDQGKDRPVVVIGRRGGNLVGVPLTTKRIEREAQIAIGTGEWDPKRRTSYARIWRMLDLDPDGTRREGAVLERGPFDAVVAAVEEYYDVRRSRPSASSRAGREADFDFDY